MEESADKSCDICKISYASDEELRDHMWSLMHHIKIEQKKKGSVHNCSLCFASCPNIIEYGKHLNEEKHKLCLAESRQMMEDLNKPREHEVLEKTQTDPVDSRSLPNLVDEIPEHDTNGMGDHYFSQSLGPRQQGTNQMSHPFSQSLGPRQQNWGWNQNRHRRSFSQPDRIDWFTQNQFHQQPAWGSGVNENNWLPRNGMHGSKPFYEDDFSGSFQQNSCDYFSKNFRSFENPHWHDVQGEPNDIWSQWEQSRVGFNELWQVGQRQQDRGRGRGKGRNSVRFEDDHHSVSDGKDSRYRPDNYHWRRPESSNREEMHERRKEKQRDESEQRPKHGILKNTQKEQQSPTNSTSSEESSGLKRRRDGDDQDDLASKTRRGNRNHRINANDSPSQSPSRDFLLECESNRRPGKSMDSRGTNDRSRDRFAAPRSSSETRFSRSSHRNRDRDLEAGPGFDSAMKDAGSDSSRNRQDTGKSSIHDSCESSGSKHMSSSDSSARHKSGNSSSKYSGDVSPRSKKKKGSSKSRSPDSKSAKLTDRERGSAKRASGEDRPEGEGVLEKAEKLCKELREKRELMRKEKDLKEKQKKIEKNREINTQIKSLSEKNKENIKGHLNKTEGSDSSSSITSSQLSNSVNSKSDGLIPKLASSSSIVTDKVNVCDASAGKKISVRTRSASVDESALRSTGSPLKDQLSSAQSNREDIERIRKTIENSVNSTGSGDSGKMLKAPVPRLMSPVPRARSPLPGARLSQKSPEVASPQISSPANVIPSPVAKLTSLDTLGSPSKHQKEAQNKDSLLKMVNSPRSRKERMKLAEMLRTYAKSQNKLTLPRFKLQLSGFYDKLDQGVEDLQLEDLSPDVQLQIAHLIEADVKPDIVELEKMLGHTQSQGGAEAEKVFEIENMQSRGDGSDGMFRIEDFTANEIGRRVDGGHTFGSNRIGENSYEDMEIDSALTLHDLRQSPNLTLQDLAPQALKSKPHASSKTKDNTSTPGTSLFGGSYLEVPGNVAGKDSQLSGFSQSSDVLNIKQRTDNSYHNEMAQSLPTIKTEKVDSAYDIALSPNKNTVGSGNLSSPGDTIDIPSLGLTQKTERMEEDNIYRSPQRTQTFSSPMHDGSHFSREFPQRESENQQCGSALEKVTAILKDTPTVSSQLNKEPEFSKIGAQSETRQTGTAVPERGVLEVVRTDIPTFGKDADINSMSSGETILDQVYQISLHEEELRQEVSIVDQRMVKLQRIIEEANVQLNKYSEKKEQLLKDESDLRSSRMKLLQESRSLQSSTSSNKNGNQIQLPRLTEAQMDNLGNPLFVKFLMSQRNPSDLSSVGGLSNVETGSQADPERDSSHVFTPRDRRASLTSNQDSDFPVANKSGSNAVRLKTESLMQSVDLLTGSTACSSSELDTPRNNVLGTADKAAANNSNLPQTGNKLEKVGFITLDSLMDTTKDIGSYLRKSLEATDGTVLSDSTSMASPRPVPEVLSSELGSGQSGIVGRMENIQAIGRQISAVSGESDIVVSGSDVEKQSTGSGRLSMQYMGALPKDISSDTFVKQLMSGSNPGKVIYTVVSSQEALSEHLKKISDSGVGTSLTGSMRTQTSDSKRADIGHSGSADGRHGLVKQTSQDHDSNFECQSQKSTYSLGEKIKRRCEQNEKVEKERSSKSSQLDDGSDSDHTLEEGELDNSEVGTPVGTPNRVLKECSVVLERLDIEGDSARLPDSGQYDKSASNNKIRKDKLSKSTQEKLSKSQAQSQISSPTKKKLKTKKERDRSSKRKQKEEFIMESSSDPNSPVEESLPKLSSLKQKLNFKQNSPTISESQEMIVETGSEDTSAHEMNNTVIHVEQNKENSSQKSLLDGVQLETPSDSDSRSSSRVKMSTNDLERLRVKPQVLESFREAVKKNLKPPKHDRMPPTPTVEYKGPEQAVAALQLFNDDLYVCYQGTELRRFNLKTGECVKELDCSPFQVQCLVVTSHDEVGDMLFTGGACKKLMVFKPQNFALVRSHNYDEKIQCLHENWGKLFVGLLDGVISVRSLKVDKEVDTIQVTDKCITCLASTSAGLTKMLCLGTSDSIIYLCDASTGLLITMLEGHQKTPLCIQIDDQTVYSGSSDKRLLLHDVRGGSLKYFVKEHKSLVTGIHCHRQHFLTCGYDKFVRCYSKSDASLLKVYYGAGKGKLTCILQYNGQVLTGNRDGLVEAVPLSRSTFKCKCEGCSLVFGLKDHLLYHIIADHTLPDSRMVHCPVKGCKEWISTHQDNLTAEDHIKGHLSSL